MRNIVLQMGISIDRIVSGGPETIPSAGTPPSTPTLWLERWAGFPCDGEGHLRGNVRFLALVHCRVRQTP